MRILIILALLFIGTNSNAVNRRNGIIIRTPNGPMRFNTVFDNKQKELDGEGTTFFGRAKINGSVYSVYIRGCGDVVLGDLEEAVDDKDLEKRLKAIRAGDNVRLRMSGFGSCNVEDFKKN